MARKTTKPPEERVPTALRMSRKEADQKIAARLEKTSEMRAGLLTGDAAGARQYEDWDSYNVTLLTRMFTDASEADSYSSCGPAPTISLSGDRPHGSGFILPDPFAGVDDVVERIKQFDAKVNRLRQLREQLELYEEPPSAGSQLPGAAAQVADARVRRAAFIVHGHDEGAREATARILQQLEVEPIILNEQTNQGRTLVEKIEAYADVPFAVVLLTPDDVGGKAGSPPVDLQPRARQNVILEAGFFWGKLTRSRVCGLYKKGVELPSDLGGLGYVEMDDGRAWRFKLADELDAAGIAIDYNLLRGK